MTTPKPLPNTTLPLMGFSKMDPGDFIAKWVDSLFGERQGAQLMFMDICKLVGHPDPGEYGDKNAFTFEKWVPGGFTDAYLEGRFGWEFKGSDDDLDTGLNQLLRYQVHLKTPPLLIVSSFNTIRVQTNFPGMETVRHEIPVAELDQPAQLRKLQWAFFSPSELRPNRTVDAVTKDTADLFQAIVEDMEQHAADPEKLARYLNQIVFCLYAEDAGLLPGNPFSQVVHQHYRNPPVFDAAIGNLFEQMAEGGMFGATQIAHFNGDLFSDADTVVLSETALQRLEEATRRNWRNIEPSIFGTLFERALDASKRAHLGAHYTSADDIMLVVEPVVMAPLRAEWEEVQREVNNLLVEEDRDAARVCLAAFQQRLFEVEVLDPACGSGNFLYLALRSLLDLEKEVIDFAAANDWRDMRPTVKPDQMLGLEVNAYAAELARTALWIGYIQWHQNNGFPYDHSPILTPLVSIRRTDAILADGDVANPREPDWPPAEFIIGNPPFLGRSGLRRALGDRYTDNLYMVYGDRLPNSSDICCYWFEKARGMIADGIASRAGLLATQGIRGKDSRTVLQRIKHTGDIFLAYPDKEWMLDGATVHISIVGFDDGSETERLLDGTAIEGSIHPDLTVGVNTTTARRLNENSGISFEGPSPKAPFDITPKLAAQMLAAPLNVNGRPNSDVVRPVLNARDITQRPRGMYTVDFGMMELDEAHLYETPFEHIKKVVYPKRLEKSQATFLSTWWRYARPRPGARQALEGLQRYIATPRVSKHRVFVWVEKDTLCNDSTDIFARDDDYTFGVLHSRLHEIWARVLGTQLREAESGFRYTPTTCFETFPFPQPTDEQREAIAEAARNLNKLREDWLNPEGATESQLKKRTLTNLYNARPTWLHLAHQQLDNAVSAAYNWPDALSDAEILERLLPLNLERAGWQGI